MKTKINFLPLLFLLLSWSAFAQEPENGSFEDISCEETTGCDIYYFYDNCMGPLWHNANRAPRVLENECVFNAFETPFGDHVLQVTGASQGEFFPTRNGDAFFYDLEMLNGQKFDINFWGKTHYWDAYVGLEFYAVEEIEASSDLTLNLWPLTYIDLTGGYDIPIVAHEWNEYTVPLDLSNQQNPINQAPVVKYNHLLIVANHHGWGQVPAVAYLDNFSITPCTFDSEATIYHHIDVEDCGRIEFVLDCDLENVSHFIWDFGDGSDLVQTESAEISHLFQYAGEYTVNLTIIDDNGCIDELTAQIKVSCDRCTGIEAEFEYELEDQTEVYQYDPETGKWIVVGYRCHYQFTDLSVASPGHNIVSWHWDFGNGGFSDMQNPSRVLDGNETYTVCLSIEDDQQCTETFCIDIETCTGKVIKIPPSDGRSSTVSNDEVGAWQVYPNPFQESVEVTYPIKTDLTDAQIQLFNIKGELVFQKEANTAGRNFLDLQELSSGMYVIATMDAQGAVIFQQQIIKK